MTNLPRGPLEGLRILDLTQALAGPFATQVLADLGADVVKVEAPGQGDMSRLAGPFVDEDIDHRHSGYFHSVNRNKRGIVVDLKSEQGRKIILELVTQFDVIVENFRVGVMDRLGLSYETLRERNPKLVYATVRGYGDPRSGKTDYMNWPAYDVTAQAMGGIMAITGPGPGQPMKVGPGVGDTIPALYLAIGILGAVHRARETGAGQFVDVAMVDAILAVCERTIFQYSFGNIVGQPEGNNHPFLVPFGIFSASDGHIALGCPNDHFFRDLCKLLDRPELAENPAWQSMKSRGDARQEVVVAISEAVRGFTRAELIERLGGKVPCTPLYNIEDVLADPYFEAREMIAEISCEGLNSPKKIAGVPLKFSETPGRVRHAGPGHGEHTDAVLIDAGFTAAEVNEWRAAGVVK